MRLTGQQIARRIAGAERKLRHLKRASALSGGFYCYVEDGKACHGLTSDLVELASKDADFAAEIQQHAKEGGLHALAAKYLRRARAIR